MAAGPSVSSAELLLTVDAQTVRLSGAGFEVSAAHGGVPPRLAGAVDDVRRARAGAGVHRVVGPELVPSTGLSESMRRAGALLAESFLPGPLGVALGQALERAEASDTRVRVGVQTSAGLTALPWEALPEPRFGTPLALHRLVTFYRHATTPTAVRALPGPLRIVVAIAAPI